MSLLYTVEALRARGHECVIALARPRPEIEALYRRSGFEVLGWPLQCWDHSTVARRPLWNPLSLVELFDVWRHWERAGRRTLELTNEVDPDVVHLNSMPLSPSAAALAREGFPFVWHVREPPPDQSWRTRRIRALLRRAPARIFISDYDRQAWMGKPDGVVIHNFVDKRFFETRIDPAAARRDLDIASDAFTILFLGGTVKVKGCHLLLDALALARREVPNLVAIMPDTQWQPARTRIGRVARRVLPLVGAGLPIQTFEASLRRLGIEGMVRRIPFDPRVERLIAASDVMVFPALAPHFARPVIEAAAMGRPSVGTNIGGVNELIADGETGVLTEPGSARALADALVSLARNPGRVRALGDEARSRAMVRYNAVRQSALIEAELTAAHAAASVSMKGIR